MNNSFAVGIDIGGSHITCALVDVEKGIILNHSLNRASINAQGKADEILSSWCDVIQACCMNQNMSPSEIGIAMPGPFEYAKGISLMKGQNKYDALNGLNIKHLLAERLSITADHITFSNDAACFLQGEVYGGAAKGCFRVIGLTLGTGFGSAMFYNKRAEDADLWCSPFKEGIAEDYLSTRWFVNRYFELTQQTVRDVKELTSLRSDMACVQQIFQEFGRNLGTFLLPHVQQGMVETIVVGGNIANAFNYFSGELRNVFVQNNIKIQVKKAELGEHSALLGAASYCFVGRELNKILV